MREDSRVSSWIATWWLFNQVGVKFLKFFSPDIKSRASHPFLMVKDSDTSR